MELSPQITLIVIDRPIDFKIYNNISFIREDRVVGSMHLEAAIEYSKISFQRNRNISDSIYKEIMLYLSLQRQVSKAIDMMGVKDYIGKVIVLGDKEFIWENKFKEIEITDSKLTFWGVKSPLEILTKMAAFSIDNA